MHYTCVDFHVQCLLAYFEATIIDVQRDKKSNKINVVFDCEFDPIVLIQRFENNMIDVKIKDWINVQRQVQSYINKSLQGLEK